MLLLLIESFSPDFREEIVSIIPYKKYLRRTAVTACFRIVLVLIVVLLPYTTSVSAQEQHDDKPSLLPPRIITSPGHEYSDEARLWQGIPGIERAPNGRLWVLWYSGGTGEQPGNYIVVVTSDNDGKTWSAPRLVIHHADANVRCFDPCLWHDPLDRMWLFWAQSEGFVDGRFGVWAIVCDNAAGEEPDWSEPQRISNGIMMNKPTVLSTSEWLLPAALWNREPFRPELSYERKANVICSTDEGETWEYRGGADAAGRSIDEHMIVEKQDGKLWMLIRMPYGIAESISEDRGKTWSRGEKSTIPGPNARFFIRRLRSGNLLLVNHHDFLNDEGKPVRKNLTAFLSENDGETWKGGLLLDEREGVSYPDGIETEGGKIYIVYDYSRQGEKEILLAVFREEDILQKRCVSKDARLRILVNKAGKH